MGQSANRWKLGLFVVAGFFAAVGGLFWLGAARFRKETVAFVTYFDEQVTGLDVGAPVKFRGVSLGTVKRISFTPDKKLVAVDCELDVVAAEKLGLSQAGELAEHNREQFVPPDLRAMLGSSGITGVKFVLVDVVNPKTAPPPIKLEFEAPWAYIPSMPSTMKGIEDGLTRVADTLPGLTNDVKRLVGDVEKLVDNANKKLEQFNAERFSENVHGTLDEARAAFKAGREVIDRWGASGGPLAKAIDRFDSVSVELEAAIKSAKIGETAAAARDVVRSAGNLGPDVRASLLALREALEAIRRLADALEQDPGSLLRGRAPEAPPAVPKR